jgi:hypothetical protein
VDPEGNWLPSQEGVPSRSSDKAQRKRLRKIRTQGNCGSREELAAASRKKTRYGKVVQRKGHGLQGQGVDKVVPKTSKGRTLGRREQCNKRIRKQDLKKIQLESKGNDIQTHKTGDRQANCQICCGVAKN